MPAAPGGPGCPHAAECPGCPLIEEPYAAGLALKAERAARALRRQVDLEALRIEPVQGADAATDYRIRAKLVTDAEGRLGLFAAGTHRVVDTPGCRVLAPGLREAVAALRSLLPLPAALAGVDAQLCDRGVLLCLIVEGTPAADQLEESLRIVSAHVPGLAGLAWSVHRPGAVQLLGQELRVAAGNAAERYHFAPATPWHFASHGAFTQVHPQQTLRLHDRLERELVARAGSIAGLRVLELYAGSGVIALRLAARGARVSAVESFTPALERLAAAAEQQGLAVETSAFSAEDFLKPGRAAARFDVVVVNPPRRGLSPPVRRALAEVGARLLAYISCEPETFARDLAHLRQLGWASEQVVPFDLIPQSLALESLAVLEPAPLPAPRVLFEDERSLALFKPPFEPTTPQGEARSSLLERARTTLGLPELTPVHRLDQGTSGVCWFARRPEYVAPLAQALAAGQKTYLALAEGAMHRKGKVDRPLREAGKLLAATTRYRRRALMGGHSLLELHPIQGRKHQLRRHLAAIGHPILGDERYGRAAANRHFEHRHGLDRPFLHCAAVRLDLPGGPRDVRAELPGDLAQVLESLEGSAAARGGPCLTRPAQIGEQDAGGDGDVQ